MNEKKMEQDLLTEDWKRNNPNNIPSTNYPSVDNSTSLKNDKNDKEEKAHYSQTITLLKLVVAQVIINILIGIWASYDASRNPFGGQQAWLFIMTIPALIITSIIFIFVLLKELVRSKNSS
ncbi:hypothetical protein KW803_01445 [Candidatus Saccharibacteria bacterium]|nr:hypothetical protein [Candidatus Saccharibacteria bacterium]